MATVDGRTSLALRGIDYAGYDVATTIVVALLVLVAAVAIAGRRRWARVLAAVAALLACFWAALVDLAAANPSDGRVSKGVIVSVGDGAFLLAAGALLALIGAVLGFLRRGPPEARPGPERG